MTIIRPNLKHHTDPTPRWDKLPLPFHGQIALGNATQFKIHLSDESDGLFVAIEGRGAYTFCSGADRYYVQEKLGIMGGDAANLADLINAQNEREFQEQGRYYPDLCKPTPKETLYPFKNDCDSDGLTPCPKCGDYSWEEKDRNENEHGMLICDPCFNEEED